MAIWLDLEWDKKNTRTRVDLNYEKVELRNFTNIQGEVRKRLKRIPIYNFWAD